MQSSASAQTKGQTAMAPLPRFNDPTRKPACERVGQARRQLIDRQPFYGVLALNLNVIEGCPPPHVTMATDGVNLFYDEAFVSRLTDAELRAVIAHETLHCAYRHFARRGTRDPRLWNM